MKLFRRAVYLCVTIILGGVFFASLIRAQNATVTIEQHTSGSCSPRITDVSSTVTINCAGVDPKALERLNEALRSKNLNLKDELKAAEEWASKYLELEKNLSQPTHGNSKEAKAALAAGDFDRLEQLLDSEAKALASETQRAARSHFNRAQIFELQFQLSDALPHYQKAYAYEPDNASYALAYARVLQSERQPNQAKDVYAHLLDSLPAHSTDNQIRATALAGLTSAYIASGQVSDATATYRQFEPVFRGLKLSKSDDFRVRAAEVSYKLAWLLKDQGGDPKEIENEFHSAIDIYEDLARTVSDNYWRPLALAMSSLASSYRDDRQIQRAIKEYTDALAIFRSQNPLDAKQYIAQILLSLSVLYNIQSPSKNSLQALQNFDEAARMFADLADEAPQLFKPTYGVVAVLPRPDPNRDDSQLRMRTLRLLERGEIGEAEVIAKRLKTWIFEIDESELTSLDLTTSTIRLGDQSINGSLALAKKSGGGFTLEIPNEVVTRLSDGFYTAEVLERGDIKAKIRLAKDQEMLKLFRPFKKSYALIIAVSKYPSTSGYRKLPQAINQAKALESLLRSQGFDVLPPLYDEAASKTNIERALTSSPATSEDRLLVYFGGHGDDTTSFEGKPFGFLVPFDGQANNLPATALPVADLRNKYAQLLKAKQIFFMLDSCQSGLVVSREGPSKEEARERAISDIESMSAEPGRVFMTAGRGGQPALDVNGGIFTTALIDGIRGAADVPPNGAITLWKLYEYVRGRVADQARRLGKDQDPDIDMMGSGRWVFVTDQSLLK